MAIAQPIEIPTISTYHKIYEANDATYFTQYIGPSSIAINPSLLPGDVLVDIESNTISYININGQTIPWTSVASAINTRHPTITSHFILVPLQNRFSWLSYTGYEQWRRQALDSNPADSIAVYIDRVKGGNGDMPLDTVARLDEDMDLDRDAEGETDKGSDTMEIYWDDTIYNIPAPVNHSSDKDEDSEYESDSDTSIYQLDRDTLDLRIDLASKAQKTFSNIKGQGRFVQNRSGGSNTNAEFPVTTEEIYWDGLDVKTYLPYSGQSDREWIRHLNRISQTNMPFLNHFNFESDTVPYMTLKSDIRTSCSAGNTVIVNGWFTDGNVPIFDVDSVSMHRDIYKEVDWQDANLRDRNFRGKLNPKRAIMRRSGIREFMARSIDHSFCGNALDLPNVAGLCPSFIRGISDDIMALERTSNVYCGPGEGIMIGPKVILYDVIRAKSWDLLTHAGFATYIHHDADGQMTWVTCRSGAKLWFIIHPKASEERKRKTIEELFTLYDTLLPDSGEVPNDFEVSVVLLEPGQILIMPPGVWHSVYTPVGCMTSGGHFLMYDTMHLTYIARSYDTSNYPNADGDKPVKRSEYATNESQSVDRQILRMMLSLKYVAHSPVRICRRPLMAMMVMVKGIKNAGETDYDPHIGRSDIISKEVTGERKQALLVCKTILSNERWTWVDIERELQKMPLGGWSSPGEAIDLSYLISPSQGSL